MGVSIGEFTTVLWDFFCPLTFTNHTNVTEGNYFARYSFEIYPEGFYTYFQWTEDRQGFRIQYLTLDALPGSLG